jgi:hypothetical protein
MTQALQPVPTQQTPLVDSGGRATLAMQQWMTALQANLQSVIPMTSKLFDTTLLTTTTAAVYTVTTTPSNIVVTSGSVRFTNETITTVSVTAYAIPSGGAVSTTQPFLNLTTVAANSFLDVTLPVLSAGASFQAKANVTTAVAVSQLAGSLTS